MGEEMKAARAVSNMCQRLHPLMDGRHHAGSADDSTSVMAVMRAVRREQGMKQKDLALRSGYTRESVCMWEKGTRTPTVDQAADMAAVLGYRLVLWPEHWEMP